MNEVQIPTTAGISAGSTKPESMARNERFEASRAVETNQPSEAADTEDTRYTQDKAELIAEIKENLEKLNTFIPVTATILSFEFDEQGEPPVVKVIDSSSEGGYS